jgi:hypothetical protein
VDAEAIGVGFLLSALNRRELYSLADVIGTRVTQDEMAAMSTPALRERLSNSSPDLVRRWLREYMDHQVRGTERPAAHDSVPRMWSLFIPHPPLLPTVSHSRLHNRRGRACPAQEAMVQIHARPAAGTGALAGGGAGDAHAAVATIGGYPAPIAVAPAGGAAAVGGARIPPAATTGPPPSPTPDRAPTPPVPSAAPPTGAVVAAPIRLGSAETPDEPAECLACLQDLTYGTTKSIGVCGHRFCYPCAVQTIRDAMSREGVSVPHCPSCDGDGPAAGGAGDRAGSVGGRGHISEAAVEAVAMWCLYNPGGLPEGVRPLGPDEVSRFVNLSITAALRGGSGSGGDGGRALTCPNPACGRLFAVDGPPGAAPEQSYCPNCAVSLCGSCGLAWEPHHAGRSCADTVESARRDAEVSAARAALGEGATGGTWKPCPACGNALSKFR